MALDLNSVNQKVVSGVTSIKFLNIIGWIIAVILIIGIIGWVYWWWYNRKQFNKIVKVNTAINGEWVLTHTDRARTVKLGSGGYEVLFLQKLKIYKVSYGSRTGGNTYEFYVLPDGYWYSGKKSVDIQWMDEHEGLVPIVTTNPLMRAQYTALETHVEQLHGDKKSFMDKWGSWIFSIAFILIAGVLFWLMAREFGNITSQLTPLVEKVGILIDRVNELLANTDSLGNNGGLIPATP